MGDTTRAVAVAKNVKTRACGERRALRRQKHLRVQAARIGAILPAATQMITRPFI
jgi:hypothetical protein